MLRALVGVAVVLFATSARADKLDTELGKLIKTEHIPGMSIAVVKDGKVIKLGAYGVANVEHGAKVTPATRFEIASMSKMFIATAIRILADEGKLDLEDPISKYFEHLPASWKGMRIRHLVSMSAGLPEDWELICYCDTRDEYDDKTMLESFTKLKLLSAVGERFHYSGPGYAMLGMIVTKVTGKPYTQLVAQRIFAPAGMTESTYNDPATIIAARADGYRFDKDASALKRGYYVAPYMHGRADTGMLSTPRDLAKWAVALDGDKIVRDPARLFVPFASDDGKHLLRYAYGWMPMLVRGHRVFMHSGGFRTGFSSIIIRLPDDRLTLIAATNCSTCKQTWMATLLDAYVHRDPVAAKDSDPGATDKLVKALQATAGGTVDPAIFGPDALSGIAELLPLLKSAPLTFYGRHSLPAKLSWLGRDLTDYISFRVKTPDGEELGLDLYRDAQGVVQDVELTP